MTSRAHRAFRDHILTGWTCIILRCEMHQAPKACVLLLVSWVMTLVAALTSVWWAP